MKYIKEIIINNFQSHKDTHLEFVNGLNTIIGESDKGKSAIIRAIKWVMLNEPQGNSMVRDKCSECSVTLVFDDGVSVTRSKILKGKKTITSKNIYIINYPDGTVSENENFGTDVPEEVLDACGVKILKIDKDLYEVPNFLFQLEAPFLISSTGSDRSKTIGKLINANLFDSAIRDIKSDMLDVSKKLKEYQSNLDSLNEEMKLYENLEEEEKILEDIDMLISSYESIESSIDKLKSYVSMFSHIKSEKLRLGSVISSLQNIDSCELILKNIELKHRESSDLNRIKTSLDNISKSKHYTKNVLCALKDIDNVESVYYELKDKINCLNEVNKLNKNMKLIKNEQIKYKNVLNMLPDYSNIESLYDSLISKGKDIEKLHDVNKNYKDTIERIKKGKSYLITVNDELLSITKLYSSTLRAMGKCPTCFTNIDEDSINNIINGLNKED
ncbi:AAA family ATPase [Alkalithermobacter paradoxus]|uniref:Nuclease SbcCD subunit C n=1 Tax=Alkalithermobacter paradoxus TaxID=29349 RepID=A0A1V4I550_9FIRM|nr:chromosome segregation protein [[Clostridium] thermoalcaliphilum]